MRLIALDSGSRLESSSLVERSISLSRVLDRSYMLVVAPDWPSRLELFFDRTLDFALSCSCSLLYALDRSYMLLIAPD